ncbi:MAG TPA: hypothetical protein VF183_09295 [Acidimicrobiales bacterium]
MARRRHGRGDSGDEVTTAAQQSPRLPSADVVETIPTSSLPSCEPVTSIITDPAKAPPAELCAVDPEAVGDKQAIEAIRQMEQQRARGERDLSGIEGFDGLWFRMPQGGGYVVVGSSAYGDGQRWSADVLVRNDMQHGTAIRVEARLTLRDGSTESLSAISPIVARPGEPVPVRLHADVPFGDVVDAQFVASAAEGGVPQIRSFYLYRNYALVDEGEYVWGLSVESLWDEPLEAATVVVGALGDDSGFRFLTMDVALDEPAFVVRDGENSAGTAGASLPIDAVQVTRRT